MEKEWTHPADGRTSYLLWEGLTHKQCIFYQGMLNVGIPKEIALKLAEKNYELMNRNTPPVFVDANGFLAPDSFKLYYVAGKWYDKEGLLVAEGEVLDIKTLKKQIADSLSLPGK